MRMLRFVLLTCLVLGLSACSGSSSGKKENDKDGDKKGEAERGIPINPDKLVGTWELTKSEVVPPGTKATVEFTRDGKMTTTATVRGKTLTASGTYKINGDKITATQKGPRGQEKTETETVRTLDDTNLVIVDPMGKVEVYKRK
jgi:uncharacterized protein (TIGR03066 family)